MKRQGFTLWGAIGVVAAIVIIAAILFPIFARARERPGHHSCMACLSQIALGFKQYLQDYDEFYPPAKNSGDGPDSSNNWAGVLQPYLKSPQIFQCYSDMAPTDRQKSSYAYNACLSKANVNSVRNPALVVLNFEVTADLDNWTQTGRGPEAVSGSTRHLEGSHFSFVDGHVKWYRPGRVRADMAQKGTPTFAIR